MRKVQMEYPDKTIHTISIEKYYYNPDIDKEFIDYYETENNQKMYALLKTEKGKIFKDSTLSEYTYEDLSKNKIKKSIKDLPDLIENYETDNNQKYELEFEVYITNTGSYIPLNIAQAFNINKKFRNKTINNTICVPINDEEIKRIELMSSRGIPQFKAKKVNIINNIIKTQSHYTVYCIEEINKYFINEELCNKYKIGKGTHFINGKQCKEVTYDDINTIEEQSLNENVCLKPLFEDLTFKKQEITVYVNRKTSKYYLQEDICINNNIGKGYHFIDNSQYREVTNDELNTIDNVEIIFKPLEFIKSVKEFNVYVDEKSNRYFVEDIVGNTLCIGTGIHYINNKLCKEVLLKEIKDIEENTMYDEIKYKPYYTYLDFNSNNKNNIQESNEQITKIEIYNDINNDNKLYMRKKDCIKYNIGNDKSFKYINNNECSEISKEELLKIENPIIKPVYLLKEVNFEIIKEKEAQKTFIVCKYENFLFINKALATTYNIKFNYSINVDSEEYVHVKENDIEEIENNHGLKRINVIIKPTK